MKRILFAASLLVLTVAGMAARTDTGSTSVAGDWEVTVKGPAAHGDLAASMQLEQDGTKVKGTFTAHGKTHKIAGQFIGGELTVETTDTPADSTMSFTARLKDDGTLAGYLSSAMGDMAWTASRVKRQH